MIEVPQERASRAEGRAEQLAGEIAIATTAAGAMEQERAAIEAAKRFAEENERVLKERLALIEQQMGESALRQACGFGEGVWLVVEQRSAPPA